MIAQWLALIKDLKKHHESEKSKKKLAQELSLNASEISIDQQVQIEQNSKNDDSKKVSIKIDENWYETVLQETKKLDIKKNESLITCEWSHWITCHDDKYEEHHKIKKQNQYYSWESWEHAFQNKEKWSKKSLYKISIERQ